MSEAAESEGPAAIEAAVRRLWSSHGLPPPSGTLGRGPGPVLRQLIGTYTPGDPPLLVVQRAVAADVDARATALGGGRAFGTLRREGWAVPADERAVAPLLDALAVWSGGPNGRPYDAQDRMDGVQRIAGRLARLGVLVAREGPVRLCPSCAAPRSPERTVYHEEVGDTFLVRFPLEADPGGLPIDALVWVDSPWRLLGTTALLVNPELPYATVEYHRGDVTARLLTSRSSLGRLKAWLPGADLKTVEERPGRTFAGRKYLYPLRHEFPDGASLSPPSGTVQAVPEVGDSGTGIVPLVPGHGGSDAQIAHRLGIHGWPLLTLRGTLDLTLMHKYSGLDLETANEFVARDLTEGGSVLARMRVLRGVPYCGTCGRPVVWFPGRCWCLEPGRLPAEQLARYAQILPHDRPVAEIEVTAWPVSETQRSRGPGTITLLECDRCSRLEAPDGPKRCPCGGGRRPVGRRLTTAVAGAFAAWARNDPVPHGDAIQLYLGERRRAPTVVHHLAAMAAVEAASAEVHATVLPTVSDVDVAGLVHEYGADAVRAAFVRTLTSEGPEGPFVERCRQEARRLERLLALASSIALALDRPTGAVPAAPTDRDLEAEDRALLARWGATELKVLAAYEELRPAEAHRRLLRFVELDLARYLELVRPREGAAGIVAARRGSVRALATVVSSIATAIAPIAPFTAESVTRKLRPGPRSLFDAEPFDVERPPPDEALAEAWDRWLVLVRAVDRFRADRKIPAGTVLPSGALVVTDDALGDRLRGDRAVLERLARLARLEIGSPRSPWEGRRRQLLPVESEIQKAYPSISTQIAHLLRRMPPRKPGDLESGRGFSVFVQGQPHQITPQMLAVVESLPERVVPVPCSLGELFVELPAGTVAAGASPVLSPDASWLVRRVARRLRAVEPATAGTLSVRVLAVDPLAKELRERWSAIAAELGVAALSIDDPSAAGPHLPAVTGRTRLGARWTVEIPGLDTLPGGRRRPPARRTVGGTRRMPVRRAPTATTPEIDFADEKVIRHEDEVRALGEKLDQLLDAPLLGPAKVALAWEAGYSSLDGFTSASFEQLVTLPGFGRPVAARLFSKLGRPIPPPSPRVREMASPAEPEAAPGTGPLATAPAAAVQTSLPPSFELPMEPSALPPMPNEPAPVPVEEVLVPPPTVPPPEPVGPAATEAAPAPPTVEVAPEPPRPVPEAAPAPPSVGVPEPRIPEPPVPPAPRAPAVPPPYEPAYLPESARSPPPAPPPPAPPPAPVGLEVEVSQALLPALQPFLDATSAGHRGLAIVRELPERIRTLVGPRPAAVYWLSNLARDRTIRPDDLAGLAALVRQGVEANGISVVFLEGIEYLTRIHGLANVLTFLKELDRLVREHEARAWLHLTPGLLSPSDTERMMSELGLSPPAPAEDAEGSVSS